MHKSQDYDAEANMSVIGPGTRVKCIKRGAWNVVSGDWPFFGYGTPEYGKLYTVRDIIREPDGKEYLSLCEIFIGSYHVSRFIPLDGDKELERLREIALKPSLVLEDA